MYDGIISFADEQRMNFDDEKNDFIFIFKRNRVFNLITGCSFNTLMCKDHNLPSTRERIVT